MKLREHIFASKIDLKSLKLKKNESLSYFINWICNNPEAFIRNNQQEICKLAFLTQPSLSRFTKRLGFSSFKNLQIYVAQKLYKYYPNQESKYEIPDSSIVIRQNVFEQYTHLCKLVYDSFDLAIVDQIVDQIIKAKQICFIGMGSSGWVLQNFARQFKKFGIDVTLVQSINQYLDQLELLKSKQMHCIILSKYFVNVEIMQIVKWLNREKISFSIISTNPETIKYQPKYLLLYESFAMKENELEITCKIDQCFILDTLLLATTTKIDFEFTSVKHSRMLLKEWNKK